LVTTRNGGNTTNTANRRQNPSLRLATVPPPTPTRHAMSPIPCDEIMPVEARRDQAGVCPPGRWQD
jgi:hypothetical protein